VKVKKIDIKSLLKKRKTIFLLILFIIYTNYSLSLFSDSINFDRLTVEDGLSQSVVNCIFQDKTGYIWIGTKDGLNRYDGYNFKIYKNDPANLNSLSNNTVNTVYEDEKGRIWVGTINGLNILKRDEEKFKRIFFKNENFKNNINNIKSIIKFEEKELLIGTFGAGALVVNFEGKITKHYLHDSERLSSLSNNRVTDIFKDSRKNIWILTVSGLNRLIKNIGIFKRYFYNKSRENELEFDAVYAISETSYRKLIVGVYNSGLYEYDFLKDTFSNFSIRDINRNFLKNTLSIIEDDFGNIWFATDGNGLLKINIKTNKTEKYLHSETDKNSISFNEILTTYKDREGTIWLGTDQGGISKFNLKERKFKLIKNLNFENKSFNIRGVWAIYKFANSPYLWIGTDSKGLIRLNTNNGAFRTYKKGGVNSINHNQILSICKAGNDGLWIGTDGGGVNRYSAKTNSFTYFTNKKNNTSSISNDYILSVMEDSDGVLWTGSYAGGLSKTENSGKSFKNYLHNNNPNSISGNFIVCLEENDNNTIWIGTYGFGLDLFDKKKEIFKHYKYSPEKNSISNDTILSLHLDTNKILWIGTRGGGLNRFDTKTGKFRYFMEKDGLANNTVTGILEDNSNNLWLSTKGGISKFNKKTEIFRNYDGRDGIQSREFNFGSFFKDENGIIYFGGINGVNYFNPDNVKDNSFVTECRIIKIKRNKDTINIEQAEKNGIRVKINQFPLYIEFSQLSYISPLKNRYAFMIEGLDDEWHYTDAKSRFIIYNTLPYGEYKLLYKGSNNDGIWGKKVNSLTLLIIPPFYHTTIFIIILLLIFSVVSYFLINFVRRHIKLIDFWKKRKYIGNFELIEKIGTGGMGTIFKACNILNKTDFVAIKVLKPELFNDEKNRKRFKREAVIIDQLDHPNIVKVIERGISGNDVFMAMELLEGRTLSEKISEEKMKLQDILHIIDQVTDALEKVHKKNIIHRDLKPDNIMLINKNGDENFVKLLDFGLATTEYQTRLTQTGMVVGTINYMAPEQITESKASAASDIYSIGVILYEMTTGKKPYSGESMVALMRTIIDKEPINPLLIRTDIPKELGELIIRMMDKKSEKRPELSEIIDTIKML